MEVIGRHFFKKEVIPKPVHQNDACGHFINKQIVQQSLQVSKSKNAHIELKTGNGIATTGGIKIDRKLNTYPIT